jgi:hypothetical protein
MVFKGGLNLHIQVVLRIQAQQVKFHSLLE